MTFNATHYYFFVGSSKCLLPILQNMRKKYKMGTTCHATNHPEEESPPKLLATTCPKNSPNGLMGNLERANNTEEDGTSHGG